LYNKGYKANVYLIHFCLIFAAQNNDQLRGPFLSPHRHVVKNRFIDLKIVYRFSQRDQASLPELHRVQVKHFIN
jgi:hypothetical protein